MIEGRPLALAGCEALFWGRAPGGHAWDYRSHPLTIYELCLISAQDMHSRKGAEMGRNPKYLAIAEALKQRVLTGLYQAGEPLPAEAMLAEEFQVNRRTLRRALAELEDGRLVIRRHGRGTFANQPRTAAADTVLYVGNTEGHYQAGLYQALSAEARERNLTAMSLHPETAWAVERVVELARDGARLVCAHAHWPEISTALDDDARVVLVSSRRGLKPLGEGERPVYAISVDAFQAAAAATDHLLALGHRRIAFVDWTPPSPGARLGPIETTRPAYRAYSSALRTAGVTEEYVIGVPDAPGDPDYVERHYQAVLEALDAFPAKPTALFCAADFRAGPVVRALRQRGLRVPQECSVVGIGNTPWVVWLDPPLTSVDLGQAQMARLALPLLDEPAPPTPQLLHVVPQLIERHSTGPVPASASSQP